MISQRDTQLRFENLNGLVWFSSKTSLLVSMLHLPSPLNRFTLPTTKVINFSFTLFIFCNFSSFISFLSLVYSIPRKLASTSSIIVRNIFSLNSFFSFYVLVALRSSAPNPNFAKPFDFFWWNRNLRRCRWRPDAAARPIPTTYALRGSGRMPICFVVSKPSRPKGET